MDTSNELDVLRTENRRLRKILAGIAEAGLGQGALVEIYDHSNGLGVAICRADCDEVQFAAQVRSGFDVLGAALGVAIDLAKAKRVGVTADDATTAADAPREE